MKIAAGVLHIPFKSERHNKVIDAFRSRLRLARDAQRKERELKWQENEDIFMMYVPETEADTERKSKQKGGKPQYTTISVPYSYAMLLTAHTYLTSVFLGRTPVMQVQGRHGESAHAEQAIEALLDYQLTAGGNIAQLYVWLLDPGKYGHGVLGHYWDSESVPVSSYVDEPVTFLGVPIPGKTKKTLKTTHEVGYEGNRLYNIRPQDFFPDPRIPLWRFQEGEFCIVYDEVSWNKIQRKWADGRYYNVKLLDKENAVGISGDRDVGSPRVTLPNEQSELMNALPEKHPHLVKLHEFHWEIIPSEFGISDSKYPEKWVFTIANEGIVLSAQPLGLSHGKFPFDVLTNEVDGYSLFTRSSLEMLDPLNKTMEWLLNSHFYNVRAALNNMFVADPSRVNVRDIEQAEPGKLIRLRPSAYGQDIRTMLAQFPVQDITRSNLADMETIGQLAQRMHGVSDNAMGMVNSSGRKTATEVRSANSFGVTRMKTVTEWHSAIGFAPLTQKLLASSQQLHSVDRKYRIVGDLAQWGEKYISVNTDSLQGMYDFVAVDGTMPVDRFAQANLWQQIFQGLQRMPNVMQAYDMPKMFAFVAQLAGLKNIERFKVQVMPDQAIRNGVQQGNLVPMGGQVPTQIPNIGPTQ